MSNMETENIIGSAKRQVAVGDVKPWPEILFQVKPRDPLAKWLLIIPLLAVVVFVSRMLFIGVVRNMRYYGDVVFVVRDILVLLLVLLAAAEFVVLIRVLRHRGNHTLTAEQCVMQGLGDACVIRDVKKTHWHMVVPEQLRLLNIIAIEGGFANNGAIGRLILPNCTERLANGLLHGCKHLAGIHLPDRLREVPPFLLEKCPRLQAVVIPPAAETIGRRAFAGCTRLKDVYITAATTEIAEDAFDGCGKLFFHVQEASAAEQFARKHNINYSYH